MKLFFWMVNCYSISMDLMRLGKRIRGLREKLNLTQQQLGHSLGVTAEHVLAWEIGKNAPDMSLLIQLARVLGVQLEWLLGDDSDEYDTFEATVFISSIRGFAEVASSLAPRDMAIRLNNYFQPITETVLRYNGVPIKYIGDGFLAYFSGPLHEQRAFDAAHSLSNTFSDIHLLMSLDKGPIHLGSVGYGDYAKPDIIGATVNDLFMLNNWSSQYSNSNLLCTDLIYNRIACDANMGIRHDSILGSSRPIYELN